MTASHDPDRFIRTFLSEGEELLSDSIYDAVRADIEQTRQRARFGPWRTPFMSKIVPIGLAAAALVVALFVGVRLFGSPDGGTGGPPDPTATLEASLADPTPSPTPWTGIPRGPSVVTTSGDPVQVTVDVTTPGWEGLSDFDAVHKNDDGLDSPDYVGAALLAWAWPSGTKFLVYGDPCRWSATIPETPATTPGEIAAGFTSQMQSDATEPIDITVGGYTGKAVTVTVPMTYHVPGATRDEQFSACDQGIYGFYGTEGRTKPERYVQGPGQIDDLWILDVEGRIVILDASYSPATPTELVEEVRALAESATFEVP